MNIDSNLLDGIITISGSFSVTATASAYDATPYFDKIGDEYVLSFNNLENVSHFKTFTYDTLGMNETRYLIQYYRLSRNGTTYTEWYELKKDIDNFPTIDSKDKLYIDIKWIRTGTNINDSIRLLEYQLIGELERTEVTDDSTINLNSGGELILKPPYIYKVFSIRDIEIISSTGYENVDIKYRYSQDNSRTWSKWEILTKENITTTRINPIKFFQIEYSITNNSSNNIRIQDINLIGNFQNVSLDYQKSNLYGIRECCSSNMNGSYDENGNFIPNPNLNSDGCSTEDVFKSMTDDEKSKLYNPYNQTSAVSLLNKLSNDSQNIFGHDVIYFLTDPDKNGYDYSLHEYSLYNIVCENNIKVSVEGNNFPDSQVSFNQFDLSLFSSMEVHITKDQFKKTFGIQYRPSKEDFIYFCNLNRMYQVDHAQQFRSFNNSSVYYKLILKKYNQKSNIQASSIEIQNKLEMLTQNTTIEELFGLENSMDKAEVANKQQFRPLSKDPIRLEYKVKINNENIDNSTTVIAKHYYDMDSVDYGSVGVEYFNLDPILKVSDNIGFMIWFNINNYISDEIYNLFDFYSNSNNVGWRVNLSNDKIITQINEDSYEYDLLGYETNDVIALDEDIWYCYVLNINQRDRNMEHFIYKRNVDFEEEASRLKSTILRKVYYFKNDINPVHYHIDNMNPVILGSDMKLTNIRLFSDIIPEDSHNKILNQYTIGNDSKFMVFGDNATKRIELPNFPLNE